MPTAVADAPLLIQGETGTGKELVARCLPRPKPGQSHPATRSFQAIRIAVNAEFSELAAGLAADLAPLSAGCGISKSSMLVVRSSLIMKRT